MSAFDTLYMLRKVMGPVERSVWNSYSFIGVELDIYELNHSTKDYDKLENHFRKIKDSETKYRELYKREVIENVKLRNKLTIDRIKMKECKKYLDAYIDLYIKEVEKNRNDKKDDGSNE